MFWRTNQLFLLTVQHTNQTSSSTRRERAIMNSARLSLKDVHVSKADMDIAGIFAVLAQNRWRIAACTGAFALIGACYSLLAQPIYESDVMIQVDTRADPTATRSMLDAVSSINDNKSTTAAESQILSSRAIVTRTVDKEALYIDAKPHRFPLIGTLISRYADGVTTPGILGAGGYAWGTESITMGKFNVPAKLEGKKYELTLEANHRFLLSGPGLDKPVTGEIGKAQTYATSHGPIEFLVDSVKGEPGVTFDLYRNSRLKTIEKIQTNLAIQEKVKDSGILVASLRGNDPLIVSSTLKEIANSFISQNMERKSLEASNSLEFLRRQLPELKSQLELSQQHDTELHRRSGVVDLSEEARQAITQASALKAQLFTLQQQRRDVSSRYAPGSPNIVSIDKQIAGIEDQMAIYAQQMARFPDLQQEVARSEMQVKVDTALYTALLNNAQQLELVKAGKVGTVRLIDTPAVPEEPIYPKKPVVIILFGLFGLLIGLVYSFIRSTILRGVSNPGEIERALGINVYATIPYSKRQQVMLRSERKVRNATLLAEASKADPAVEGLRALRMTLNHGRDGVQNKVVLMSGPTPGVGKSFVSANFARVVASSGKRVLLIDADLRNGHLHRYFHSGHELGLAEFLTERAALSTVIQRDVVHNLDFISTGERPAEPGELLLSPRLNQLIGDCTNEYDLIVIDAPPILTVSDAQVLAQDAGAVFMVAMSEVTKLAELEECAKRMDRSGVNITGVILNGSRVQVGEYGYDPAYGNT
jgi:tyrosine-protein kinase Etk/Wzc